jgi:hypothetical protein
VLDGHGDGFTVAGASVPDGIGDELGQEQSDVRLHRRGQRLVDGGAPQRGRWPPRPRRRVGGSRPA